MYIDLVWWCLGDCKCQNGGTCFHDATLPGGTMCVCPEGFSGILCETCKFSQLSTFILANPFSLRNYLLL